MIGFWLNLDAELELQSPGGYRTSPRIAERVERLRPRLGHLLGPSGRIVGQDPLPPGSPALAWCPTPSALAAIEARKLRIAPHPALQTLRRVNHRAFCAELGQPLEGAEHVYEMPALRRVIAQPSPTGDWVLKRPFGFAGRERRRAIGGVLDESTEGFARATFEAGQSLQVEPWLTRELDVSLHGWVETSGTTHLAEPVRQSCDAMGRFVFSEPRRCRELPHELSQSFQEEASRVGQALHDAGYFGPFGIDGFTYLDERARVRFNPRSEINARLTMGYRWPDAFGPEHAVLDAR